MKQKAGMVACVLFGAALVMMCDSDAVQDMVDGEEAAANECGEVPSGELQLLAEPKVVGMYSPRLVVVEVAAGETAQPPSGCWWGSNVGTEVHDGGQPFPWLKGFAVDNREECVPFFNEEPTPRYVSWTVLIREK